MERDAEDKGSETEEYEEKEYEDIREKNEDINYITRNEDSNEFENKLDEKTNSSNVGKKVTAKESEMYNHSTILRPMAMVTQFCLVLYWEEFYFSF